MTPIPFRKTVLSLATLSVLSALHTQAAPLKLKNADGNYLSSEDYERIENKTQADAERALVVDPKLAAKANEKYYSIQIQTFNGIDSYSPDALDVTRSYLGFVVGNTNYNRFLMDFDEASRKSTVIQFSAKFSLVPTILRKSVQDKVDEEISARAEKARAQYTAAAALKINQQVGALVAGQVVTPEEGQVMAAKFIKSAQLQIDHQVELAKQKGMATADDRLDKIQTELTFQEFVVKIAHKVAQNEKGAFLIFGQVGKAAVEGNLGPNSGINNTTPLAWWGPRGMSTQGTGQVQLGLEWVSKNNIKIGVEVYFFHDRLAAVSGRRLLTNLIYMEGDEFDTHHDFWEINSDMEKFFVKIPSRNAKVEDQYYFSTGNFNGKRAFSAGALTRILPQVSIQLDATFDRPEFDHAITESLQFHATDRLTFYLINENVKNLRSHYDTEEGYAASRLGSAGVGVSYRLMDVLFVGVHATVDVNAECRAFYNKKYSAIKDDFGCGGGAMLNMVY